MPTTEVQSRADFSHIRYAQCWEDADILVQALAGPPGRTFVSVASAGDNSLALLTLDPAKVVAVDLNPAQLHCLALRVAAYRCLSHGELLELMGSRPSSRRLELYKRCEPELTPDSRQWWDNHPELIRAGMGAAGKFERYFRLFRHWVLPLVHGKKTINALLQPRSPEKRRAFYHNHWNNRRWRLLFQWFFSRRVMGKLGRDPAFFEYVEGSVADRILARTTYALTELDPASNPYLHWILTGRHGTRLPLALRAEHFHTIRSRLDRLEWRLGPVEEVVEGLPAVDGYNLSDIFEYMSEPAAFGLMEQLALKLNPGGRLAYWNMLAPRSRPSELSHLLEPQTELAESLHRADQAFFYSRFVVEQRP